MALGEPFVVGVADPSGVADARRRATTLAASLGFDATDVGRVAIVVTEAATNLVKHATGGEILGRAVETDESATLEILALDRGPGIERVDAALRDGFSSAGSAGFVDDRRWAMKLSLKCSMLYVAMEMSRARALAESASATARNVMFLVMTRAS